jgi:hypothetical protein
MRKIFTFVLLAIILSCILSVPVAATSANQESGIVYTPTFSVSIVIPENQIQRLDNNGFFDIFIAPNQTQVFILAIKNETSEDIDVKIEAITATTAENGEILISKPGISDRTLQYSFADLVTPNVNIVTIPAWTEQEFGMRVTTPSKPFDGIILGAFYMTDMAAVIDDTRGVANVYRYGIAVRMTHDENKEPIEPDFQIQLPKLLAGTRSTGFYVDIRNTMPEMFKNIIVSTHLLKGSTPIFTRERKVDFAPNSIFPLSLAHDVPLTTGEYTAQIKIISEGGEIFSFEQAFIIERLDPEADDIIAAISGQGRGLAQGAEDLENPRLSWITLISICWVIFGIIIKLDQTAERLFKARHSSLGGLMVLMSLRGLAM